MKQGNFDYTDIQKMNKENTLFPQALTGMFAGMLIGLLILLGLFSTAFAQDTADAPPPNPEVINQDGGVKIEQFIIDDFENADLWYGGMWIDDGVIQVRKVFGAPNSVRNEGLTAGTSYSLGAKVRFLRRGFSYASIEAPREIIIPGITEKLTVWVQGRGVPNTLYAVIRDFEGKIYKVPFGKTDFTGWKQMEAIIPERIVQQNNLFSTYYRQQGITFVAFFVEFDLANTVGSFFIYFDNLQATSNVYLYEEQIKNSRLTDEERIDPIDNW